MKIYLIKHKGKTILNNFLGIVRLNELFKNNKKISSYYVGDYFLRKKDAINSLQHTFSYPEFFEIVSAEIQKSKQDNRKKWNESKKLLVNTK